MQDRIAFEFAWIDGDRRNGYRLCSGQAPDFLSQFGVFFFDFVEARHHVIK
jgi:hypothetical protein